MQAIETCGFLLLGPGWSRLCSYQALLKRYIRRALILTNAPALLPMLRRCLGQSTQSGSLASASRTSSSRSQGWTASARGSFMEKKDHPLKNLIVFAQHPNCPNWSKCGSSKSQIQNLVRSKCLVRPRHLWSSLRATSTYPTLHQSASSSSNSPSASEFCFSHPISSKLAFDILWSVCSVLRFIWVQHSKA